MHPKTQQKARQFASMLDQLLTTAMNPPQIAIIADITNHLTLGYVLATMGDGRIPVYGVPFGSAVVGMRCYVTFNPTGQWIWVSYAPQANVGLQSGSIVLKAPGNAPTIPAKSGTITLPTTTATGYYWGFFFYVPQLPTATVCIWDMNDATNGKGLRCTYSTAGVLSFTQYGIGSPQTLQTTMALAPHQVWWIQMQIGNATPILANGYSVTPAGTALASGSLTTLASTANQTFSLLSANDGTLAPPVGTWISKLTFGTSAVNATARTPLSSLPTKDAQIPNGRASAGSGILTLVRLLCGGQVGQTTLPDSGSLGVSWTLQSTLAQCVGMGPY